jgi:hypothetical protein
MHNWRCSSDRLGQEAVEVVRWCWCALETKERRCGKGLTVQGDDRFLGLGE